MRPASLLLALLAAFALAGTTSAQDGTPGAAGDLPVTPDPSECTVEAPTIDELIEISAVAASTPAVSGEGTLASAEEDFTPPEGEPADDETTAQVVATLRELIACVNSGNFLYIFAFLTEDLLTRLFAAEPISEEVAEFFQATPPGLEPDAFGTLVDVQEATVLPDGRVGALMHSMFPGDEDVQVDYVVLEEQEDGRWLIDELVEDLEDQFPPAEVATPAT